jgi:hypothetical protein
VDEVAQVRDRFPSVGRYLGPPCALRHRAHLVPYCPEGHRSCGVPVWSLDLSEYERII